MGFMVQNGTGAPKKTVSSVGNFGQAIERDKKRISENLPKIKHWTIRLDSYTNLPNEECTWFIDPPYQFGGHAYKESNKGWDYQILSKWCQSRLGQVIVCENTKANWLPFFPIGSLSGSKFTTTEAMWCNDLSQPRLF